MSIYEFGSLSEKEIERRHKIVRREMKRRNLDCIILVGYSSRWNEMGANVRYLTNYSDPLSTVEYVFFPLEGDSTRLIQLTAKRSLATLSLVKDIRSRSTGKASEVLSERIKANGLSESGIGIVGAGFKDGEFTGMPYNVYDGLVKAFPNARFIDVTDMFTQLRMVKSQEEIKYMEESAKLCDLAFEEMVRRAKPGIKEYEWFADLHKFVYGQGAEHPTFLIGSSGPMPTKDPMYFKNDPFYSSRTLKKGDVIISEIGPKVNGYASQSLQMVSLGEPQKVVKQVADKTAEVFESVAEKMRPGTKISDALEFASHLVEQSKGELGKYSQSLTPLIHSVGMGGPDPTVKPLSQMNFEPGMVLMLEIGPSAEQEVFSWLGTAFVITETGNRSLSRIPPNKRTLAIAR